MTRERRLAGWMAGQPGDLQFMPHGNDSNRTHRRTFEAVCPVAAAQGLRAWACLNQDVKTVQMRVALHFDFGAEEAAWKARAGETAGFPPSAWPPPHGINFASPGSHRVNPMKGA
jgi:hypothetical protein